MHKNFGEWYRLVTLEPDGMKLQRRWAGVKTWATALRNDDQSVLETVRIFQGLPGKASRDTFLAAFQKQDAAFPQRNDLELMVLAGASLVDFVQSIGVDDVKGLRTATIAGAALDASRLRTAEPRLDEIAREVRDGLQTIAVKYRERQAFDPNAVANKADEAVNAMKQISSISTWEILKEVLTRIFEPLVDAVRAADVELLRAAHNHRSADEETNILWWVEGGCSRDTNKSWAALKDGAAIIAGSELADLTDVALGPRDAAALLDRVLAESKGRAKEAPIAAYINALPDEWARERASKTNHNALDLTPLALAVVHRGTSDTASWQQYFDTSSGMKSSTQLTAARVARQSYIESILFRALADLDTEE